ncbi:MAG: hypothetical protein FDZ69_12030 [Deltaproteobacteria bacterium]|nr:MAG: hypothetical protein FDZ69_12030 [Deltaproteobacteria bacterium]
MQMTIKAIWAFLLVAAVQLAVPGYMIYEQETTLRMGSPYRFKTAPIDPYDPFRGRYVQLRIEASSTRAAEGEQIRPGDWVYVPLATDEDGFAQLLPASLTPPAQGDYLLLKARYASGSAVHLVLPFDRYYAEETVAPEIEAAYNRNSRREQRNAFIAVRVRAGKGVIEELFIDNLPVREYLQRQAAAAG